MTDSAQQLVCLLDVREHARRRRAWSRAFSGAALKGYEEIMGRRVEQLAELFARHAAEGRPADVGKCLGAFTYVAARPFFLSFWFRSRGPCGTVWAHFFEAGVLTVLAGMTS